MGQPGGEKRGSRGGGRACTRLMSIVPAWRKTEGLEQATSSSGRAANGSKGKAARGGGGDHRGQREAEGDSKGKAANGRQQKAAEGKQ